MARLYFDAVNDGSIANEGGVIILFCMIVMSVSIISMLIFACGDSGESKPHRQGFAGGNGGGDGTAYSGGGIVSGGADDNIGGDSGCGGAVGGSACGGGGGGCGGGGTGAGGC